MLAIFMNSGVGVGGAGSASATPKV